MSEFDLDCPRCKRMRELHLDSDQEQTGRQTPPQLVQYVAHARSQGVPDKTIRLQLIAAGWPAEVVDDYLRGVHPGRGGSRKRVGSRIAKIELPDREKPEQLAQAWRLVGQWSGQGDKNTPKFEVGHEWAIEWLTEPGAYGDMNFWISIHRGDGSYFSRAAGIIGIGSDASYMHHSGTYYLEIRSGQMWEVRIWDKHE